ncbi:unnamed protein product [Schistosoma curassoni]|uniref:DUF6451 domain-containing protein n=1 Tax=Schistosoma curassoni TaxID=6186 RepID=A0A183KMD3_9TREM|nr:unnamed protein product [Schistosoma curassoni]
MILKCNTNNTNTITPDGETLDLMENFMYLSGIIYKQGGFDADVKVRIGKAKTTFLQLKNICNSKQLSTNIKVRIFSKNITTVLPYGAETWRITTLQPSSEGSCIYKQLSTQDAQCLLVGYHQQEPTLEENKPNSSLRGN